MHLSTMMFNLNPHLFLFNDETESPISLEGNSVSTIHTTADNDAESQSNTSFAGSGESADDLNKGDRNALASITPSTNDDGSLLNVPRMDGDIATQEHNNNGHSSEPDVPNVTIDEEPDECRSTLEPRAAEANLSGSERLFSSVRRKIFVLTKLSSSKGKIRTFTNETRNIKLVSGIKRPATTDIGTTLKKPRLEPTISMNEGERSEQPSLTIASDMKSNHSKIRTQKEISDISNNSTVTSPP